MTLAYLKPPEIRGMNHEDRQARLKELRGELIHERGVAAMGGSPPSPGKIRQIRRQIARILTIQNEEWLGVRGQKPKKAPALAKPKEQKPQAATPKKASKPKAAAPKKSEAPKSRPSAAKTPKAKHKEA